MQAQCVPTERYESFESFSTHNVFRWNTKMQILKTGSIE
jgi:hypothetical protein